MTTDQTQHASIEFSGTLLLFNNVQCLLFGGAPPVYAIVGMMLISYCTYAKRLQLGPLHGRRSQRTPGQLDGYPARQHVDVLPELKTLVFRELKDNAASIVDNAERYHKFCNQNGQCKGYTTRSSSGVSRYSSMSAFSSGISPRTSARTTTTARSKLAEYVGVSWAVSNNMLFLLVARPFMPNGEARQWAAASRDLHGLVWLETDVQYAKLGHLGCICEWLPLFCGMSSFGVLRPEPDDADAGDDKKEKDPEALSCCMTLPDT
ncbi:hypothetical protein GUJ93_ZPchr0007g5773 [Zizania palustris]|uniref:Uncharacterized protein n=1 Tax=Zizania palustris TaxID=103762 RepID=A0A8J5TCD9_ZIZPA|nr:hypothetical protein GUJ93_ZPchr0007g5773 [Zizania palustris]